MNFKKFSILKGYDLLFIIFACVSSIEVTVILRNEGVINTSFATRGMSREETFGFLRPGKRSSFSVGLRGWSLLKKVVRECSPTVTSPFFKEKVSLDFVLYTSVA